MSATAQEQASVNGQPTEEQITGLWPKLAAIRRELSWVEKRGKNTEQKYDYVRIEDVLDEIKERLDEHGVLVVPAAKSIDTAPSVSGKQNVTTVTLTYTLIDAASGEKHVVHWFGTGADSTDKGLWKAYTGALKYFFIDLFQIPTGRDPDEDAEQAGPRKLTDEEAGRLEKVIADANLTEHLKPKLRSLDVEKVGDLNTEQAIAVWEWAQGG